MPFANIRISKGLQNIHGWYIHNIFSEMMIKDFFVKLTTGEISPECNIDRISPEAIDHIEISNAPTTGATQISLDCNIIDVTSSLGIYIHYWLKTDDITNSNLTSQHNNVFSILMQNAYWTQKYLPTFQQSENTNRRHKLHNEIVDWIQRHGVNDDSENVGSNNEGENQENATQEDENDESEPKSPDDDDLDIPIEELDDNAERESI
ncbi:33349_t:CDS:2, partial [Racocetra persica]